MALFGKKKKDEAIKKEEPLSVDTVSAEPIQKQSVSGRKATTAPAVVGGVGKDYARVLRTPRITEKATFASENGAYVFNVDPRATKFDIARAIEIFYKVKPVKVNTVKIPSKKVSSKKRGVYGKTARGKKAYVFLKRGDTLEIV